MGRVVCAEGTASAKVLRLECGGHVGEAERRSVRLERRSEGGAGRDEFKEGSRKGKIL